MPRSKFAWVYLTGLPPLRILLTDWPVVYARDWRTDDGGVVYVIQREHADGRVIVYGGRDTKWSQFYRGEIIEFEDATPEYVNQRLIEITKMVWTKDIVEREKG